MSRLTVLVALLLLVTAPLAAEPEWTAREDAPEQRSAPSLRSDPVEPSRPAVEPYLSEADAPDTVAILPPPPGDGSAAQSADRAVFAATRAYAGSARWALAVSDVAEGSAALLEDFACVLGQRVDHARVPTLMRLLDRTRLDLVRAVRGPKLHYRRRRPFVGNDAPVCVAREPRLAASFSYPSGHATQGWAYAMILAALVPGKTSPLMVRGRLYGESRVVCGVHWMSDVTAARTNASAIVAALMGSAVFRADLERARDELTRALATDGVEPDAALCAREDAALREPPL